MRRATCLIAPAALAVVLAGAIVTPAAEAVCPLQPNALSAKNPKAKFTMLVRINQLSNAYTYANFDEATGGLGSRIRPQDIFVINTRFDGAPPAEQVEIVPVLRQAFPCNRIIALNGLGRDPTQPGYEFALADFGLWALMLDWEPDDWGHSRVLNGRGMPRWTWRFRPALNRIHRWIGGLSGTLRARPKAKRTRTGLVISSIAHWDYGQTAQEVDRANRRHANREHGPQIIQAQNDCAQGSDVFRRRVRQVRKQYRYKIAIKKRRGGGKVEIKRKIRGRARPEYRNLAFEISFSDTPSPGDPLPIENVSVPTADRCLRVGRKRGIGAFFFWATPDSMRLLFQRPTLGSLRPPR